MYKIAGQPEKEQYINFITISICFHKEKHVSPQDQIPFIHNSLTEVEVELWHEGLDLGYKGCYYYLD